MACYNNHNDDGSVIFDGSRRPSATLNLLVLVAAAHSKQS